MNKKAQGISLNVIIIAAIALLVLVVLSVILLGRMGQFGEQSQNCENKGGRCATTCGIGDAADYPTPYPAWQCTKEQKEAGRGNCCIKIQ